MNTIDNLLVDKALRVAQFGRGEPIQMTPEQRKLMYDMLLENYMDYAREEQGAGRQPLAINDWIDMVAPRGYTAVRRIVAQVTLRPDSSPEEARAALHGPLSTYYGGSLDLSLNVTPEGAELAGDATGEVDMYLDELIRESYGVLGQWTSAELHTLMEKSVPLPFEITGVAEGTYEDVTRTRYGPAQDEVFTNGADVPFDTTWRADLAVARVGAFNEADSHTDLAYEVQNVESEPVEVPYGAPY